MLVEDNASAWLPQRPPVVGRHHEDGIKGTIYAVGRSLLSEAYDDVPRIPWEAIRLLPDGIMRFSLVPYGQLGEYWFSSVDPDAIYSIPFPVVAAVGLPVILEHIKIRSAMAIERSN